MCVSVCVCVYACARVRACASVCICVRLCVRMCVNISSCLCCRYHHTAPISNLYALREGLAILAEEVSDSVTRQDTGTRVCADKLSSQCQDNIQHKLSSQYCIMTKATIMYNMYDHNIHIEYHIKRTT